MDSKEKQIQEIAEELQLDCHATVKAVMDATRANCQDATNVWVFMRLAELQFEINQLKISGNENR